MKNEEKFWQQWILNYSLGELLGIGAAAIIARFLFMEYSQAEHGQSPTLTGLVLTVAGTSEGLIIGYVQWRSLSRFVKNFKPAPWITVTTLTSIAGWILILPPAVLIIFFFAKLSLLNHYTSIFYTFSAGAAFGALISTCQFFIIRKFFNNALIWILANTMGWALSFLILYFALSFFSGSLVNTLLIILACISSGLVQGIVTGTSLHFLMSIKNNVRNQLHADPAL
ncbi:MAG TPA: hypothetical protein VIU12_27560 [Chryseolinea sp.]